MHDDVGADAPRPRVDASETARRLGELRDDRKAEAESLSGRAGRAPEPFEHVPPLILGHAGTLVDYVDVDSAVVARRFDAHRRTRRSGVEGIGNQVVEDLLDRPGQRRPGSQAPMCW